MFKKMILSLANYFKASKPDKLSNTFNPFESVKPDELGKLLKELVDSHSEDIVTTQPITDPLKPFFKHFSYQADKESFQDAQSIAIHMNANKTPLDAVEYKVLFNNYINLKNFCSEEKLPVLKNMYEDLKVICQGLAPLEKLGLNLTVDLTGGAVRDFVLNKQDIIKDLDIMISFSNHSDEKIHKITRDLDKVFTKEQLEDVSWDMGESDLNIIKTKLVQLCFPDQITDIFCHDKKTREEKLSKLNYIDTLVDRIVGVIKLKKSKHYEADLLITDLVKPVFLKGFDINLCQASFCLVNSHFNKKFPTDPSHLISRFSATLEFFADIQNSKLTINVDEKTNNALQIIIDKHLGQVMNKYPDYEVNFVGNNEDKLRFIKTAYFAKTLEKQLEEKPKTRNIKI